jgi:hypothetical protein
MEKLTTKLSAGDRVILFCVATGIVHGAVGITDHAMQSMAIRGFIAHNRESGAYMPRQHRGYWGRLEDAAGRRHVRRALRPMVRSRGHPIVGRSFGAKAGGTHVSQFSSSVLPPPEDPFC